MNGFVGVTDDDWCAFLAQQLPLPKTARQKYDGQALSQNR